MRPENSDKRESSAAHESLDPGIVSVNDRGRQRGGPIGPFFAIGGVALVLLVGGLASFNTLKAKLGPQTPRAGRAGTAPAAGLARTFDPGRPPPLPGATPATRPVSAVACADGSQARVLRGLEGAVVRESAGAAIWVCADGQVAGGTAQARRAGAEIPVQAPGGSVAPALRHGLRRSTADVPIMLNGVVYENAPEPPQPKDLPVRAGPDDAQGLRTEGLLTGPRAGALEGELLPSRTPLIQAKRMASLELLLPKGRTIDCGLSMRIISSLAGQVSCIVTQNVYSANGKVLLIERGSEAVGEYRSGASIGQKRLFVLWTRILTPGGVVITVDSPAADALGATGIAAQVDDHWFERIGSAFLLSTFQDALQYQIAKAQAGSDGQTLVLGNTVQAGNTMAERVLASTIDIPPTLSQSQGDRVVIHVARDLDFSNVYKLRSDP